ncbi:MAG: Holliday junction resolvase Hjc [Candidatus Anstonellales archaeon]
MRKGINAERELFHLLENKGFFVIRAAGSGHLKSPDLLAFKLGTYIGFEVKAHNKKELRFSREQLDNMEKWEKNTGIALYIAWKVPKKGFLFLPTKYINKNDGAKTVSIKLDEAYKLAYKEWEL